MFLGHMKIGTRLGLAFAVVLIMVLGTVALAVSRLESQDRLLSKFADERVPQVVTAHKWAISVLESARHTRNIFVLDHDKIPEEIAGLQDQRKQRIEETNAMEREVDSDHGRELLKNIEDARAIYVLDEDEFIRLVLANRLDEAKKLLIDKARPEQLTYLDKIYTLVDYQVSLIGKERDEAKVRYASGRSVIIGIGVLAAVASIAFAYLITRSITLPLQRALRTAQQVAGGDLAAHIDVNSHDETGQLLAALKNMMQGLAKIVGEVQNSGIQVNSSVTAIAATGKEQQATATEIAATTTEIGATSKEISATSRELVKTMNEVSAVAEQSANLANSGQAGLSRMEETMRQVMEAAGSINAKLDGAERKSRQHQPGGHHHHQGGRSNESAVAQCGYRGGKGRGIRQGLCGGGLGNSPACRPDSGGNLRHRTNGEGNSIGGGGGRDGHGKVFRGSSPWYAGCAACRRRAVSDHPAGASAGAPRRVGQRGNAGAGHRCGTDQPSAHAAE